MLSYVFMKILERRPRSYDTGMRLFSGGHTVVLKEAVVAAVAGALPAGGRVLEIGCGTGQLAVMLAQAGHTVEAFDASPQMVAEARRRTGQARLTGRVTIRRLGVDGMDELAAGAYDAAVATLVLSELSDDERRYALTDAARVLEPGGLLVIADEVVARTHRQRRRQALGRAPLLAITYLASGAVTRPLADPAAEIRAAGFTLAGEERSQGDACALITAHRSAGEPQEQAP